MYVLSARPIPHAKKMSEKLIILIISIIIVKTSNLSIKPFYPCRQKDHPDVFEVTGEALSP